MITKSSSLFFVFSRDYYDDYEYWEKKLKIVDIKWIDFGHMERLEPGQRDTGLIHGLSEVVKLLNEIMNEWSDVYKSIEQNKNGDANK